MARSNRSNINLDRKKREVQKFEYFAIAFHNLNIAFY